VAKNHYVTKRNRRPKNKRRKDYTAETMRKLREHADNQPYFTVDDLRRACVILRKMPTPSWVAKEAQ
jgi:hypothetical protein